MTASNEIVVGIGEVLWDLLPGGKQLGGAPANFAYHAAQFGYDSWAVSAIGRDDMGSEIVDAFMSRKLNFILEEVPWPTGTVGVELSANGIPVYDITRDVAWDHIPFTPRIEALAARTRAVCFGSLAQRSPVSRQTIASFLAAMPDDDDRFRIFDINLRQDHYCLETLETSLATCNVLKINDDELIAVSRMFGISEKGMEDICVALMDRYQLKMLILTCGSRGSYVFTSSKVSFMPTPAVEVSDTVGAGDSFSAAFISSLLAGRGIEEAHKKAVEHAAFVCTKPGAMPVIPQRLLVC